MSGTDPSQMTPFELENTPCSIPPDGVHYNLENPHSDGPVLIAVGALFIALMFIVTGFRFYIKIFVRHKVTPDDWTTLISIIGACAYYGLCVYGVSSQKLATHMWDLSLAHCLSETFTATGFYLNWVPAIIWGFVKTTFFLMYLELFSPLVWLRWACYIGITVNWGFYIGKFVSTVYLMAPNPGQSWQEATQNPRYAKIINMTIPIATGSLILDLYILILPMIVLWKLQVARAKKPGLVAIFGVGFLACVASTLSLVFNAKLNGLSSDYTYWVYPTLLTALLEMCIGIICSSMPALAGFLKSDQGRRILTWGTQVFSIRSRYGKGSVDGSSNRETSGLGSRTIKANTYINIDVESGSTHELVNVHSPFAPQSSARR